MPNGIKEAITKKGNNNKSYSFFCAFMFNLYVHT